MNNKKLALVFLALLLIVGGIKVFSGKGDRSFKEDLISLDTSKVSKILLYPGAENHQEISLEKVNGNWSVSKGDLNYKATSYPVQSILGTLAELKTKRVAAKSEDRWAEYEVTDTSGTRVKALQGNKVLADFIIGRFSFNQQARTATSYVRMSDEKEVFAVDGFLGMSFNQSFDAFRDKTMVKLNKDDITGLELMSSPGQTKLFQKQENLWIAGDGALVDSTAMSNYLGALAGLNGSEFYQADKAIENSPFSKSLKIKGNNMITPVEIKCWTVPDPEKPFIIQSTVNKEAIFISDSTGVFKRIYSDLEVL